MIVSKNLVKDILRLFFWYPFRWLVLALPLGVVYRIGGVMGDIDRFVSGGKRIQRMNFNVAEALRLDECEAKSIVKENLRNHLRNTLELMKYTQLNGRCIKSVVRYDGIDYLDAALDKGKGVILLTAHFGAKQLLQSALVIEGYALNQINFHMDAEELSYVQQRVSQQQRKSIEDKLSVNFIPAKGFMRPVFKCLKSNEVLIIAGDGIGLRRHMDMSYQPFGFLGKKMLFPTNAGSLAERTGAAIVPVFVVREKSRHRIVFEPALNTDPVDSAEPASEYVKVLEKYVSEYPCLWEFWEEFDDSNLLV